MVSALIKVKVTKVYPAFAHNIQRIHCSLERSPCADQKKSVKEGPENFLSHQPISQTAVKTSLEKQLDPRVPIASREGSVPVFLRKPIATCDFPGGSGRPVPPPSLDPPMKSDLGQ